MRRPDPVAVARLEALSREPPAGSATLVTWAPSWPPEPWDLDAWPEMPDPETSDAPTLRLPVLRADPRPDPEVGHHPGAGAPARGSGAEPMPATTTSTSTATSCTGEATRAPSPAGPPALQWAAVPGPAAALRSALRDLVPAPLRGGRWDPGRRGVVLVAVLGLVACAVAVAFAIHGRSHPVATALPPVVTAPADDPLTSGPTVQIDVEGRVRRPGVVELPSGARLAAALRAAGGVLPGTDTSALDLAQRVTDGQQVRVGMSVGPAATAAPSAGGTAAAPIDLNTATADQLDALPHIGPATAAKIVAWRVAHGPFTAVSQLQQVSGIGPSTYQDIAPLVTV